jgi:hypothetical protein
MSTPAKDPELDKQDIKLKVVPAGEAAGQEGGHGKLDKNFSGFACLAIAFAIINSWSVPRLTSGAHS